MKAIAYDELVLALGGTESTMGVPGVEKYSIPLKTVADAEILRERVVGALEVAAKNTIYLIERDRLLHFVVIVGGNFTGVELAGELQAFLGSILRYYPGIDPKQVDLLVLESSAISLLGAHLAKTKFGRYAASSLVEQARSAHCYLARGGERGRFTRRGTQEGGERISSATVVWAAGDRARAARQSILGLKTERARSDPDGRRFRRRRALRTSGHWAIARPFRSRAGALTRHLRKTPFAKALFSLATLWRACAGKPLAIFATASSDRWRP